jgi:hypothetical protein
LTDVVSGLFRAVKNALMWACMEENADLRRIAGWVARTIAGWFVVTDDTLQ